MASVFGHALAAFTIGKIANTKVHPIKLSLLTIFCAIIPDADVIMFSFGYSYAHPLGHRGFTHSIFFAFLWAFLIRMLFYRNVKFFSKLGITLFIVFFLATISHSILDACTNGGKGVGFFIPSDNERYFFPWRPILVYSLGAGRFFSEWGLRVLQSEAFYIGIPSIILLTTQHFFKKYSKKK
jgi:inner membrane protein